MTSKDWKRRINFNFKVNTQNETKRVHDLKWCKKKEKKTIVYACRKGENYPGLVLDRYMNSNFEEKIL